jgi:UDP-glucose 4-epimerase
MISDLTHLRRAGRGLTCMITGGAGFIGSELSRLARQTFDRVVIVDNLVNGRRENVADILDRNVSLEVMDIRAEDAVRRLMRGVDTVFHLACLGVRHSIHSPIENHEVNATATLRLLGTARETGVRRFVYVSTSEVYGSVAPEPPMSETHHTHPMTVYGASKLAGECYARAYHRTYEYQTVVVRPFNSYGPRCHHEGDSGEVIPKFMLRSLAARPLVVFGDGQQTRDFTFVSDTARGILLAGFSDQAVGQTLNLGTGREITIQSLAHEICRLTGRPDANIEYRAPRPGDVIRLCADVKLARQLLGFEPEIDLSTGLRRLLDWYASSGHSPEDLLRQEVEMNWLPQCNSSASTVDRRRGP